MSRFVACIVLVALGCADTCGPEDGPGDLDAAAADASDATTPRDVPTDAPFRASGRDAVLVVDRGPALPCQPWAPVTRPPPPPDPTGDPVELARFVIAGEHGFALGLSADGSALFHTPREETFFLVGPDGIERWSRHYPAPSTEVVGGMLAPDGSAWLVIWRGGAVVHLEIVSPAGAVTRNVELSSILPAAPETRIHFIGGGRVLLVMPDAVVETCRLERVDATGYFEDAESGARLPILGDGAIDATGALLLPIGGVPRIARLPDGLAAAPEWLGLPRDRFPSPTTLAETPFAHSYAGTSVLLSWGLVTRPGGGPPYEPLHALVRPGGEPLELPALSWGGGFIDGLGRVVFGTGDWSTGGPIWHWLDDGIEVQAAPALSPDERAADGTILFTTTEPSLGFGALGPDAVVRWRLDLEPRGTRGGGSRIDLDEDGRAWVQISYSPPASTRVYVFSTRLEPIHGAY